MPRSRLITILDAESIGYEVIHHPADFSALETAEDTHTPGGAFAKAVILDTADGPALAVVPAPMLVDLERFAQAAGSGEVCLAAEASFAALFPDCQVGAEPPFGRLYNMPVYVDDALAAEEYLTFNAGSHDDAVRILFADYERLEQPTHAAIARPR